MLSEISQVHMTNIAWLQINEGSILVKFIETNSKMVVTGARGAGLGIVQFQIWKKKMSHRFVLQGEV
jgi:hypothetical protein